MKITKATIKKQIKSSKAFSKGFYFFCDNYKAEEFEQACPYPRNMFDTDEVRQLKHDWILAQIPWKLCPYKLGSIKAHNWGQGFIASFKYTV